MDEQYLNRKKCYFPGPDFRGETEEYPDDLNCYPGGIRGHFGAEEGVWLKKWAEKVKKGTIVNVGTMDGLSVAWMYNASVRNKNRIYAVDIYYNPMFEVNLKFWGNDETNVVVPMTMPSGLASRQFQPETVDMVFLDGDHTARGVVIDLGVWLPKLKPSGLICGHDWENKDWPGIKESVNEVLGEGVVSIASGTSLWYIKMRKLGADGCAAATKRAIKLFRDQYSGKRGKTTELQEE